MVPDGVKLGHVHLKVRDLDAAVDFHVALFGMRVTERAGGRFAFLSASAAHHYAFAGAPSDEVGSDR